MTPREAEAALLAKVRAGHVITAEDHIPTIETKAELHAFRDGLAKAGRLTPELVTAVMRHEVRMR